MSAIHTHTHTHTKVLNGGGCISVRDLMGLLTPSVKLRPFELLKLLSLSLSLSLLIPTGVLGQL